MKSYLACDPYTNPITQMYSYWSNGVLHFILNYNIEGRVNGALKTFSSKGHITSVVMHENGVQEGEDIRVNYGVAEVEMFTIS